MTINGKDAISTDRSKACDVSSLHKKNAKPIYMAIALVALIGCIALLAKTHNTDLKQLAIVGGLGALATILHVIQPEPKSLRSFDHQGMALLTTVSSNNQDRPNRAVTQNSI